MKLLRQRMKQLDELGEDEVFGRYLELGSTRRLTQQLFEPKDKASGATDYGRRELYKWLKQEHGRWERWQEIKKERADVEVDLILEEAQAATPENASAQRLKVDAHKWRAERLNRADYGPPQAQVNVAVGIGASWLEAMAGGRGPTGPTHTVAAPDRARGAAQGPCQQGEIGALPPPSSKEGGSA